LPQRTVPAAHRDRIDSYQKIQRFAAWPVHFTAQTRKGSPMSFVAPDGSNIIDATTVSLVIPIDCAAATKGGRLSCWMALPI
jgi:hypothetical protein